jgi:ABC-type branched-subunit amino acid transport system ATPase component
MLEVKDVVSGYGQATICQGIDLEVKEGELVTVIGPNGSGKSTLLKTITGLVKALSGSIFFNSVDITNSNSDNLPKVGLGYVPQLENVFPSMTIKENLEMGALYNENNFEKNEDLIANLFPVLAERKENKAKNLSGGERQMLALARALMGEPKMLLLDEPTAALSPVLAIEILDVVKKLTKELGIPILLVEQNARKSLQISDRAYILTTGKVFRTGKAREILDDPDIGKAFLGI